MSRESDLADLRGQASAAYQSGRQTFVARLKLGVFDTRPGEIPSWMDSIDAVESTGWVLDEWTTAVDGGAAFAFPVFRRRQGWAPQDAR